MSRVSVLRHKGSAYHVQYKDEDGLYRQIILPEEDLTFVSAEEAEVDPENLELGIPVGIPWSIHLEDVRISAKSIEKALLQNGLRTIEDCRNPNSVSGAVMQSAAPILLMIQRIIKNYERVGGSK